MRSFLINLFVILLVAVCLYPDSTTKHKPIYQAPKLVEVYPDNKYLWIQADGTTTTKFLSDESLTQNSIRGFKSDPFTADAITIHACSQSINIDSKAIDSLESYEVVKLSHFITMLASVKGSMSDDWNCAVARKMVPKLLKRKENK